MKYSPEVIEALRVVIGAIPPQFAPPGGLITIPADLYAEALAAPPRGPSPKLLMSLWNTNVASQLPRCCRLTTKRRAAAAARLKEFPDKMDWINFIEAINHNPWALGDSPSPRFPNWRADFDWFVKAESIVRFMEGRFSGVIGTPQAARDEYRENLDKR